MPRKPKKPPKQISFGIRPAPKVSRFATYVLGLNSTTWANSEVWVSVHSSNVSAIHYYKKMAFYKPPVVVSRYHQIDPHAGTVPTAQSLTRATGQLFVMFNSGIIYRYDDVPQIVAENMYNCTSLGAYVHQYLKGKYNASVIK